MSHVLVLITIPSKEFEQKIFENAKNSDVKRFKNGINNGMTRSISDFQLHTINEANENLNNELKNKINNVKEPTQEAIAEEALAYLNIDEAIWKKSKNDNFYQIMFPVDLEDSDAVIQYFKSKNIGTKWPSTIGIIPYSLYCCGDDVDHLDDIESDEHLDESEGMAKLSHFKNQQNSFLKSVTARLTVAQVVDNVRSGASLTFDFVCYLTFASWIAAMGLLDNSVISLVASMLVSPMMGPVMAMTFGTIIKDGSLRRLGFRNLGVCFAITILFGYIFGIIALNFTDHWADQEWPTNMMRERGLPRVAWVGTLVAFPSGCAVAISLLSGNEASLVGVAISVSLLPPAVNCGLLWAFSTLKTLYSIGEEPIETVYNKTDKNGIDYNITYYLPHSLTPKDNYVPFFDPNLAIETAILGCFSLILSLINITNIIIGALILLKIKEIAPLSTMSPSTRRFFQEDLKIVREYNAEHGSNNDNIGEQVLKEWADMNGIDANHLLSDKPEARVTQFQTLNDIVRDVEADNVYRSIQRTRLSTTNGDLLRRMSQSLFQPPVINNNISNNMRKSSTASVNLRMSEVELGVIAHRRKSARRASRLSQITPTFAGLDGDSDRLSMREPLSHPTTPTVKMPLSAGVQPNNTNVFTFGDNLNLQNDINRRNRRSSQLLRRSLQQSEHLPHSLWPSARMSPSNMPRFVVTPVSEDHIPEIVIENKN